MAKDVIIRGKVVVHFAKRLSNVPEDEVEEIQNFGVDDVLCNIDDGDLLHYDEVADFEIEVCSTKRRPKG